MTTMFEDAMALVEENDAFWRDLGKREHRSTRQGAQLYAFFRDVWDPWYVRVLALAARPLTGVQAAQVCVNVADQLVAIRDDAGYRYHLPMTYENAPDERLAQLGDDARDVLEGVALNAGIREEHRQIAARRSQARQR
jgi:hypothetical protein